MKKERKCFSEWFKANYLFGVFFFIVLWLIFCYLSNNYKLVPKNLETLQNGEVVIEEYKAIEPKHFIFELLSNLFLTLGITLFITMFFTNYFSRREREDFEKRLEQFQKETAKNAFFSLFHQIVDESFFNVIKTDVIQCKKIRKNAKWIYDITEEQDDNGDKHLELLRTIKYTVQNLSAEPLEEKICFNAFSNSFISTEFDMVKTKENGAMKFEEHKLDSFTQPDNNVLSYNKSIIIKANDSVEIVKSVRQIFKNTFIYETHFANCPLANLEIQVNIPKDYIFNLSADSLTEKPIKDDSNPRRIIYTFDNAILKGQGVEFYCEKKSY